MRLIDVSKVKKIEIEHVEYDYVRGCMEGYNTCIEDMENQPEVKAIPIEWMKKFANERALNDGLDGYWHYWGTDLLQMIEQWEKENEDNRR